RIAWACWFLTAVQVIVFIIELVRNASLTSSPIAIKPSFNPMIGPSPYVLINMGARFVPCMRNVENITNSAGPVFFPCPEATTLDTECTLSQLCGFSNVPDPVPGGTMDASPEPNQWYRFIIPIFLHAGLIHIGFNLLLQLTLGREVEAKIGTLRFLLVYFSSGIFGFVFGGNYAALGIASCGASGSLFGLLALTLLDLLYHWRSRKHPVRELLFILLDIAIAFVLGLLPGLDNFSHIGGFLMGLVLGISIIHSPEALRQRIGQDDPPYGPLDTAKAGGAMAFARAPLGFFKGRKPLWWAWWLIRVGALVGVLVGFIVLLRNFYVDRVTCDWCKYLSCLDINNWCDIGNLQ
ncbi:rhomboid-domain-containing protein, partial [Eremomyces bilateralis CBS 781.70]